MLEPTVLLPASSCAGCGTEIASTLLSCPGCGRLVHAERLKQLADQAMSAASPVEALVSWRSALELLPAGSKQAATITSRIDALSIEAAKVLPASENSSHRPPSGKGKWASIGGAVSLVVLVLTKLKFLPVLLLTKGKLLLLGLSKVSTFFTMLASFSVYWSMWGWKFAGGLVLSIYVHEMGHVSMLRRLGVAASAPMFIPGFGAMVRLKQALPTQREDARVGLAGPVWGLAAAIACWLAGLATGSILWLAIAKIGAWINLFNLLPVWQLDGARAFRAMDRRQRCVSAMALFVAAFSAHDGLLAVLGGIALYRAFEKDVCEDGDNRTLLEYVALVAVLTALAHLHVDTAAIMGK